ncbi:MAG: PIN domain-containing protein [Deltaproteobacteria bacterium]|nr:PIN domain-containing protein [Deltaproteobacteria bacterium]MBW2071348.1 PIN domain-containing protein [Deltaproteobacteria bacterium]
MIDDRLLVDTSAFYALMDRSDHHHETAVRLWTSLLVENYLLLTTNYVVVETLALLQGRLGFEAARLWQRDILDVVVVVWTDESVHSRALELWLSLGRRKVSLVDCVSFVTLRLQKIEKVFAFDKHFSEQGFEVL